tara:strand:- start:2218 stop:2892 length:675 start_codon:yes stop_codon:yes gene_type:complete
MNQIIMDKILFDSIENNYLFKYICIIIFCIFIFSSIKINFSSFIGFLFGVTICYYIYNKNLITKYNREELLKKNKISTQFIKKFPEFEDFIYSITDIKNYNLHTYNNIIQNINSFLNIYTDIKFGVNNCKYNYDLAVDMKRNALNNLHSIIINIEENKVLINKLKLLINKLHNILNKYLNKMITICNHNIEKNGYDINTHFINKNELYPANKFDWKNNISFDLY